jgi:hypothetical protein
VLQQRRLVSAALPRSATRDLRALPKDDLHGFHADFLWRVAGFPCELLGEYAVDDLATEVRGIVGTDRHLSWPSWWRRHSEGVVATGLTETFHKRFELLRRTLVELVSDEVFQSAVAYSSPAAAVLLARHAWTPSLSRSSKQKRRELLAMRYLQRFVTKCETAARVGPTATGRFTHVPCRVDYRFDLATYTPRTLVSHRVLAELADHFRRVPDVMLGVAVRRQSGVGFCGARTVVHPTAGEITLNADSMAVLRAAGSPVPVGDLRRAVACSTPQLLQIVYALVRLRLLSDELAEVHLSRHPLDQLRGIVRRGWPPTSTPASELLRTIDEALEKWPSATSVEKLALLDAIARSARDNGVHLGDTAHQFYGDHLPVVEDGPCSAGSIAIDAAWAAPVLAELEDVVRLSVEPDSTARRRHRHAIAQRHRARSGRPTRVALTEILAGAETCHADPPLDQESVSSAATAAHIVTSPDIMIVARDLAAVRSGEFTVVLAECHSAIGCAGFQSRVIEDTDAWLSSVSSFLTSRLAPAQPLMITTVPTNKTWYTGPLHGVSYLEVGSPAPAGVTAVALDDLVMVFSDRGLALETKAGDRSFAVLPDGRRADDWRRPLEWLRPPRYTHVRQVGPRSTTGRVVRKRAAWRLTSDGLPGSRADPLQVFVWAQRLRLRTDLPRWIFIHPRDERKPICIDFANPFLCEELLRHMRRTESIYTEEMLPSPDDAWVKSPMGHHLSELRLLYVAPSS